MRIIYVFSAFLFLFLIPFSENVFANLEIPQNKGNERIIDTADIFSSDEENEIKNKIQQIEQETTAQIAILTIPSLEGEDIFDFGMRVVQSKNWQIGQDDKDNGLFLLIASQDHKYRFFTGYGLEGILPDLRLQQIATRYFPENFRQQHYAKGILLSLTDIQKFLKADPEIISEYKAIDEQEKINGTNLMALIFLFIFSFFGGITISSFSKKTRQVSQTLGGLAILGSIATPFIFIAGGIISFIIFLLFSQPPRKNTNNDFTSEILHSFVSGGGWSSGSGFSSGGGFSNFGGGDFGGGGFGGDW